MRWWTHCGRVVSEYDRDFLSAYSTPWSKELAKWTYEARKIAAERRLDIRARWGRRRLDRLARRLEATPVAATVRRKRKTKAMNARYVRRNGKRVYIGKKITEARKQRRAAAERTRRANKRAQIS